MLLHTICGGLDNRVMVVWIIYSQSMRIKINIFPVAKLMQTYSLNKRNYKQKQYGVSNVENSTLLVEIFLS